MAVSAILVGGGAFAMLASPASATDPTTDPSTPPSTEAPVKAATSQTTLPLFGAPLTVDVSTTPSGSLADVAVNPADGLTATKVHPNNVTFVKDDGTGRVRVVTRHGAQKAAVAAGSLDQIVGDGGWSGDVFGTGTTTTVGFEIVDAGDGAPDITNISSSDPSAAIGDVRRQAGDRVKSARATITFTSGIQSRRLSIIAVVFTKDDVTRAASQVTLSKISGVSLPADQAAGDHTWSGKLCDGTDATVAYSVAADGTITAGAVTPASGTAAVDGSTLRVKFSDTESVRIRVSDKDGNLRISADPRLRCDRATPTVNTPTSTDATQDHRPDGRGPWNGRGDGDNNDRGDGHRDGDGWGRGSH